MFDGRRFVREIILDDILIIFKLYYLDWFMLGSILFWKKRKSKKKRERDRLKVYVVWFLFIYLRKDLYNFVFCVLFEEFLDF